MVIGSRFVVVIEVVQLLRPHLISCISEVFREIINMGGETQKERWEGKGRERVKSIFTRTSLVFHGIARNAVTALGCHRAGGFQGEFRQADIHHCVPACRHPLALILCLSHTHTHTTLTNASQSV